MTTDEQPACSGSEKCGDTCAGRSLRQSEWSLATVLSAALEQLREHDAEASHLTNPMVLRELARHLAIASHSEGLEGAA